MCGIFGGIGRGSHLVADAKTLSRFARQRGRDSSGVILHSQDSYAVHRADFGIRRLISGVKFSGTSVIAGHSRLITQGLTDNQPVIRDNVVVVHNGIVLNALEIWDKLGAEPQLEIDTEVIPAIAHYVLSNGGAPEDIPETVLELAEGVVNCVMVIPRLGKLLLFSNNGSLFTGAKQKSLFFSSEEFPLKQISCSEISQVEKPLFFDVPISEKSFEIVDHRSTRHDLVPILPQRSSEENLLGIPPRDFGVARAVYCRKRCPTSASILKEFAITVTPTPKGTRRARLLSSALSSNLIAERLAGTASFPFQVGGTALSGSMLRCTTWALNLSPTHMTGEW